MRIVYNASTQSNGPSLNDCLYAGPSFGQSILDILLRFRVHTDIEKGFLMISVAEEDRDVLQFLWIDDISKAAPEVLTLRFKRVMFGVSSSPFLLNATIRHHIKQYSHIDPQFVEKFIQSIYVDDVTYGSSDVEEAYQLYLSSKNRLAEGGFNLRKFLTNSPKLRKRIRENECFTEDKVIKTMITEEDELYTKNMLGTKQEVHNEE